MSARDVVATQLPMTSVHTRNEWAGEILTALTAAGYRIIAPGELDGLLRSLQRAEDGAGTLPAKEAVKLRPADWHAVSSAIRALQQEEKR